MSLDCIHIYIDTSEQTPVKGLVMAQAVFADTLTASQLSIHEFIATQSSRHAQGRMTSLRCGHADL